VKTKRQIFPRPRTESSFNDAIKPSVFISGAGLEVVNAAKGKARFVVRDRNPPREYSLDQSCTESARFRPRCHCSCFLFTDKLGGSKKRCAVVGERQLVEVLQNQFNIVRVPVREKTEGPEVSLTQVAQSD
jgi:hypothetical protein